MNHASRVGKLRRALAVLWVCSLSACIPWRRSVPPELLPQRVVLALDGLDYRDVMDARARGRFAGFHPPARMLSTFPSISDIAWHAIFQVQPPPGYQRVYFSTRHNAVLGDALSAIRPIEYEERMDHAFDTKFHHLGAYLISGPVARREVDTDVELVLRSRRRETVYLYNVGPDALQHTRGDIARYLDHLSERLDSLQARYRRRTGRALEVLVLSDHGHNRARDAAFVPITEALAAHGFQATRSMTAANQVAFSVDGVTTGFGVFAHPDSVQRVARLLATVPGVEVVSAQLNATRFMVLASRAGGTLAEALIERRDASRERAQAPRDRVNEPRYRYTPVVSDPLELAPDLARLPEAGPVDSEGFAAESTWVAATLRHRFPAAVPRIVHGHTRATKNPAPILVSLRDDARVGLGMVSVANRMRPLGGTHGALGESNAVGVMLSNFVVPRDAVAWRVADQFGGFADLREAATHVGDVRVLSGADLHEDPRGGQPWIPSRPMPRDDTPLVLVTLPAEVLRESGAAWLRFDVLARDQSVSTGQVRRSTAQPLAAAWRAPGTSVVAFRADSAGLTALQPGASYQLRVVLELRGAGGSNGGSPTRESTLFTVPLRAAPDGTPWSY